MSADLYRANHKLRKRVRMPLLGISVIGPLSECSTSVRVKGQITGATVEIFMTGHSGSIGGGVASAATADATWPIVHGDRACSLWRKTRRSPSWYSGSGRNQIWLIASNVGSLPQTISVSIAS